MDASLARSKLYSSYMVFNSRQILSLAMSFNKCRGVGVAVGAGGGTVVLVVVVDAGAAAAAAAKEEKNVSVWVWTTSFNKECKFSVTTQADVLFSRFLLLGIVVAVLGTSLLMLPLFHSSTAAR